VEILVRIAIIENSMEAHPKIENIFLAVALLGIYLEEKKFVCERVIPVCPCSLQLIPQYLAYGINLCPLMDKENVV
jgi:hypothetical protein